MNPKTSVPVVLCTGPTGGHLFPALSSAEVFRAEHPEVEIHVLINRIPSFAQSNDLSRRVQFHVLSVSPLPAFFSLRLVPSLLEYAIAFLKIVFLFLKLKPKLVIGFGSYSSVPGVLAAAFLRIPILLHEQNALLGRANQFLAVWANRIAVSFPETQGKLNKRKVFWSGYPLRLVFYKSCTQPNVPAGPSDQKQFRVLVFGGSQGARRINQMVLDFFRSLSIEERSPFAVIHIVGNDDAERVRSAYEELKTAAGIFQFSDRICEAYRQADLVISRAGAGTIFELAQMGRAAILIPYPHAYAHQKINADYLASRGWANVIEEKALSVDALRRLIMELRENENERKRLAEAIRQLGKADASHKLVETGWELACGRN